MKVIRLIVSLLLAAAASASTDPRTRPLVRSICLPLPRKIRKRAPNSSSSFGCVLSIRGGSNFRLPIEKAKVLSLVIGTHALNGAIGLAAPEKLAELYCYHPVRDGSFAHLCHEFVGAAEASLALTLYLSGDKSTLDVVAIGTLPLAYVTFRHLLKGTATSLNLHKGIWDFLMALFVVGIYALLTRLSNADRIAKIYAALPTIIGLSGMLDLNYSRGLWGIEIKDRPTESAYRWMSRVLFQCGTLFLLLLHGVSAYKATGYISLAFALQCLDFAYITKDREGCPNQPKWLMNSFAAVWCLVALTLLQ